MENRRGSTDGVDDVAKDSPHDGIQEHNFAQEFSSDLPSVAMSSSAPSGSSSPYALSLQLPSAGKVDDRDVVAHGDSVSDAKKLEHALPCGPMRLPTGFGMVDSTGSPPVVYASNHDVAPGAFPERSARNTATHRTFRSRVSSHDFPREFTTEESKQEEGVTNSATASIGLFAVEAQRVPDRNEDGMVIVAEDERVRTKWYQRRWITLGLACCLVGTVVIIVLLVVLIVLVVRQPAGATSPTTAPPTPAPYEDGPRTLGPTTAPLTPVPSKDAPQTPDLITASPITGAPATPDPTGVPPTPKPKSTASPTMAPTARAPSITSKPTSLTSIAIACNFLSISNVTRCRSTVEFGGSTTGSSIPSEIGLLMQLMRLNFYDNSLTSSIPSEIGLLTQLTYLSFSSNFLTSSIPSEIGLLTQLTLLDFYTNTLTYSIPSEIGLLTQLTYLSFSYNSLTFSMPSEIGLLTQLTSLDFSSNQLTSTFPSEIGLLTQLTYLYFSYNLLTSSIPSEIGLLTQLTRLDLSVNQLSSTIPSEIGHLTKLAYLSFFYNTLIGTIPSSLCSLTSLYGNIWIGDGEITCASGCCY